MSSLEHDDESMHAQPILTPRQREVAALIAEGLTDAEMAERLALTVGNHVGHILRTLGMRNRVEVAVWAVKQGLH